MGVGGILLSRNRCKIFNFLILFFLPWVAWSDFMDWQQRPVISLNLVSSSGTRICYFYLFVVGWLSSICLFAPCCSGDAGGSATWLCWECWTASTTVGAAIIYYVCRNSSISTVSDTDVSQPFHLLSDVLHKLSWGFEIKMSCRAWHCWFSDVSRTPALKILHPTEQIFCSLGRNTFSSSKTCVYSLGTHFRSQKNSLRLGNGSTSSVSSTCSLRTNFWSQKKYFEPWEWINELSKFCMLTGNAFSKLKQ